MRLLIASASMYEQDLSDRAPGVTVERRFLDPMGMGAGEDALGLLVECGVAMPEARGGRWTDAGPALRNSSRPTTT